MNNFLNNVFSKAIKFNKKNILGFLNRAPEAKLLDLGCDDGSWSLKLAGKIGTEKIYGVDIVDERINEARANGLKVKKFDLNNEKWPFRSNSFDVIHANQVIEHISNVDNFLKEVFRILKKNGYVIISTENASSWHNIFAGLMGWQMFSLTNFSLKKGGLGNPLALHKDSDDHFSSWTHKIIFSFLGLKEFFEAYNFHNIIIKGAGYIPLPAFLGFLDPRHANFITLKAYKI